MPPHIWPPNDAPDSLPRRPRSQTNVGGAILSLESSSHCWERYHQFDPAVARTIWVGKSALAKVVPTGLALLGGRPDCIAALENSHDSFHISNQIFDDLRDWKLDFRRRCITPLLQRLLSDEQRKSLQDGEPVSVEELADKLHRSGLSITVLSEATTELVNAKKAAALFPADGWIRYLDSFGERVKRLAEDLTDMLARLA